MKRIRYYFIIFLLALFPFNIFASTSIKNAAIEGADSVKVGSNFYQSFRVNFSDLKKGSTDTLGLWLVGFELDYDEDILAIESIESNGNEWYTIAYKDGNKKYVLSEFSNDPYHNACADGVLFCSDYLVTLKFYVKDTTKTSTKIVMKDIGAGAFNVKGELNPEYETKDMIELEYSKEVSKTISITRPENVKVKDTKSILSNKKPSVKKPTTTTAKKKTTTKKTTEKKKSDNNYLESLTIKGYDIDFSKDTKTYIIYVPDNVNSLDVKAKVNHKKATVNIVGNDDLKANDNKVRVKVTAENSETRTYIIEVRHGEKPTQKTNHKLSIKNIELSKKQIVILGSITGSLLFIVLIILLVNLFKDRKIDKAFDKF